NFKRPTLRTSAKTSATSAFKSQVARRFKKHLPQRTLRTSQSAQRRNFGVRRLTRGAVARPSGRACSERPPVDYIEALAYARASNTSKAGCKQERKVLTY